MSTLGLNLLEDLQLHDAVGTAAGHTQDVGAWGGEGGLLTRARTFKAHKG